MNKLTKFKAEGNFSHRELSSLIGVNATQISRNLSKCSKRIENSINLIQGQLVISSSNKNITLNLNKIHDKYLNTSLDKIQDYSFPAFFCEVYQDDLQEIKEDYGFYKQYLEEKDPADSNNSILVFDETYQDDLTSVLNQIKLFVKLINIIKFNGKFDKYIIVNTVEKITEILISN